MTPITTLPSRDYVLEHGVPPELINHLRQQARVARARAIAGAAGAAAHALARVLRGTWDHSQILKTKAL